MPFPDEIGFRDGVVVTEYQPQWPADFEHLAGTIGEALGAQALAIDHVGSTSVPGPPARYALLFRDYLRADEAARRAWGAFKQRLAQSVPDLMDYGQIKAPATEILMAAAERWAAEAGWPGPQDNPPPG